MRKKLTPPVLFKLYSTIVKDFRILFRDKIGLAIMFLMPVVLAIIIASVQNSTFELVNRIPVLLLNKDTGSIATELEEALTQTGMFHIRKAAAATTPEALRAEVNTKDALVAILIPERYSAEVLDRAKGVAARALKSLEPEVGSTDTGAQRSPLVMYYHPVLQASFRQSVDGGLQSALQVIQSRYIVQQLYYYINDEPIPGSLESQIVANQTPVLQEPVAINHTRHIPNATQHNIPAWTIFAMFFIVISLGSSIVREKLNGSIIRLRTLPTSFSIAILSKQITYISITILQAAVIFAIGAWLFPVLQLPALNFPADKLALLVVVIMCGLCAASFAICVGVYANSQEQANGFGAVSIVLLAAIGGLLVPSFVMPASFQLIMRISPLYWCLEAFYALFLQGGKLRDILPNIIPLMIIALLLQFLAFYGLKRKNLI